MSKSKLFSTFAKIRRKSYTRCLENSLESHFNDSTNCSIHNDINIDFTNENRDAQDTCVEAKPEKYCENCSQTEDRKIVPSH